VKLQTMATSISAYIDMHEKTQLSEEQKLIILEAREVILKSLELVQQNKNLGAKKAKKVEEDLDKIFNKVIDVFSKANADNPEIIETKLQAESSGAKNKNKKASVKKEKKQDVPKMKKNNKNKSKLRKADQKVDDLQLEVIELLNKRLDLLKTQFKSQTVAMVATMAIMEDLAKKVQKLEKQVEDLKK